MKQSILITIMFGTLTGCNQQKEIDTVSEGEKLMKTSREWSKLVATKNVDSIVSYWSDDAVVISAGEATLNGKADIKKMVEGGFTNPGFQISWEPKSVEISKDGDMGYLLEDTKMTMTDSLGASMTQNFKAVTIWKKGADGKWKCAVDVMSPLPAVGK